MGCNYDICGICGKTGREEDEDMTTTLRTDQVQRAFAEKFPGTSVHQDDDNGTFVVDVGLPEVCANTLESWSIAFEHDVTMEHVRAEVERMVEFVSEVCP